MVDGAGLYGRFFRLSKSASIAIVFAALAACAVVVPVTAAFAHGGEEGTARELVLTAIAIMQTQPGEHGATADKILGVVDPRTGVVTHVASTFGSPKGLLFVPNHGRPEDDQGDSGTANDQQLSD
jgi:hypothetical protein